MIEPKRAGLYSKNGTFLKWLNVSPHVSMLIDDGKTYVLRTDLCGMLRFHEVDLDEQLPILPGILSDDDKLLLKFMRITQW